MNQWQSLVQFDDTVAVASSPTKARDSVVLALINVKGGVGKTTTAVNLAAGLSVRYNVLLLDLDCQRSATVFLGVNDARQKYSMVDVLTEGISIEKAILKTDIPQLYLATGGMQLAHVEQKIAKQEKASGVLKKALKAVKSQYDFIIMDCPPSMSLLSVNALMAADGFIVPVNPQFLGVNAMEELLRMVQMSKRQGVDFASLLGIVFTMVDVASEEQKRIIEKFKVLYGDKVFNTQIETIATLAEAPEQGKTIYEYATLSKGSSAYWNFTKEVLEKCKALQHEPNVTVPPAIENPKDKPSTRWRFLKFFKSSS